MAELPLIRRRLKTQSMPPVQVEQESSPSKVRSYQPDPTSKFQSNGRKLRVEKQSRKILDYQLDNLLDSQFSQMDEKSSPLKQSFNLRLADIAQGDNSISSPSKKPYGTKKTFNSNKSSVQELLVDQEKNEISEIQKRRQSPPLKSIINVKQRNENHIQRKARRKNASMTIQPKSGKKVEFDEEQFRRDRTFITRNETIDPEYLLEQRNKLLIDRLTTMNRNNDPSYTTFMYSNLTSNLNVRQGVSFRYLGGEDKDENHGGKIMVRLEKDPEDSTKTLKRMSHSKYNELLKNRQKQAAESIKQTMEKDRHRNQMIQIMEAQIEKQKRAQQERESQRSKKFKYSLTNTMEKFDDNPIDMSSPGIQKARISQSLNNSLSTLSRRNSPRGTTFDKDEVRSINSQNSQLRSFSQNLPREEELARKRMATPIRKIFEQTTTDNRGPVSQREGPYHDMSKVIDEGNFLQLSDRADQASSLVYNSDKRILKLLFDDKEQSETLDSHFRTRNAKEVVTKEEVRAKKVQIANAQVSYDMEEHQILRKVSDLQKQQLEQEAHEKAEREMKESMKKQQQFERANRKYQTIMSGKNSPTKKIEQEASILAIKRSKSTMRGASSTRTQKVKEEDILSSARSSSTKSPLKIYPHRSASVIESRNDNNNQVPSPIKPVEEKQNKEQISSLLRQRFQRGAKLAWIERAFLSTNKVSL